MIEDELVRIKKAEADAFAKIQAAEKDLKTGLDRTRKSLAVGKKKNLAVERKALLDVDGKLRAKVEANAAGITKKGKSEMIKLRKRVEGRVDDAAGNIFRNVLEELEKV